MGQAIGMIEVEGVAGIVLAADAACKAAEVDLLGWESIGGRTAVFFGGSVAAVAASLQEGEEAAGEVVEVLGIAGQAAQAHQWPARRQAVAVVADIEPEPVLGGDPAFAVGLALRGHGMAT